MYRDASATNHSLAFQILELTVLIADYMNALGRAIPGTPQMGSLTRNGSQRSARTAAHTHLLHGTMSSGATLSTLHIGHAHGHGHGHGHPQPDILKSTPDHSPGPAALHRGQGQGDPKKRTVLES